MTLFSFNYIFKKFAPNRNEKISTCGQPDINSTVEKGLSLENIKNGGIVHAQGRYSKDEETENWKGGLLTQGHTAS